MQARALVVDEIEHDQTGIDQHLAGIVEIHRDAAADHRLHLPIAPVWLLRMTHALAGREARKKPIRAEFGIFRGMLHISLPVRCGVWSHRSSFPGGDTKMAQDGGTEQPQQATRLALALAAALATRLCHDLAGPLGTLMSTIELACDDATMQCEALTLAAQTSAILVGRLRLLRASWGGGEATNTAQLRALADAIPLARRCRLTLESLPIDRQFDEGQTQLLLNLLMLGVEALAGEGEVTAQPAQGGDLLITIHGPNAGWPAGFATQLRDPLAALEPASMGPRRLLGPLTALIAHQIDAKVTMLQSALPHSAPPLLVEFR